MRERKEVGNSDYIHECLHDTLRNTVTEQLSIVIRCDLEATENL